MGKGKRNRKERGPAPATLPTGRREGADLFRPVRRYSRRETLTGTVEERLRGVTGPKAAAGGLVQMELWVRYDGVLLATEHGLCELSVSEALECSNTFADIETLSGLLMAAMEWSHAIASASHETWPDFTWIQPGHVLITVEDQEMICMPTDQIDLFFEVAAIKVPDHLSELDGLRDAQMWADRMAGEGTNQ